MYVGAGRPLEHVLDARQAEQAEQRIPLAQTTLRGEACDFQPVATLGAFTSYLGYATHFTATATDLKPAPRWQVEVYAADLKAYTAASEAYRQRAEGHMEKMELEFQPETKTCKDAEIRSLAWRPNEIWYSHVYRRVIAYATRGGPSTGDDTIDGTLDRCPQCGCQSAIEFAKRTVTIGTAYLQPGVPPFQFDATEEDPFAHEVRSTSTLSVVPPSRTTTAATGETSMRREPSREPSEETIPPEAKETKRRGRHKK